MSDNNEDMDLELSLGCSRNCVRTKLKGSSGAGVNAGGSIVDLTFTASDSLSELVWSPHNGLSLKCAQCSTADKKPFLLWNVGPSNMIPSPSQGIRGDGTDETKMRENFIISAAAFHVDSQIAQRASFTQSSQSTPRLTIGSSHEQDMEKQDELDEVKIEKVVLVKDKSENADRFGENDKEICNQSNAQIAVMAERSQENTVQLMPNPLLQGPIGSNIDMAITNALPGDLSVGVSNGFNHIVSKAANDEVHRKIVSEAWDTPLQMSTYLNKPNKEGKGTFEEERKNKSKMLGSVEPICQKLEHTAENYPQHLVTKDAYEQNEERLNEGCSLPLEIYPGNCSNQPCSLKGKEKALSDSNIDGRFSNDLDDGQESVESCNSAGLLGKRRWNFDQEFIGESSKRVKRLMDGCPESTSIMKHDSSFLNWISNMVNGFSKSSLDEVSSLGLTLAQSSHEHTEIIHETMICGEHQESVSKNTGFQTVFRSLYSPGAKLIETQVSRDDSSVERLQDPVQAEKVDAQNSPINSPVQNGASPGRMFNTNEKVLPSTEFVVSQSDQAWNSSTIPIHNEIISDSAEDKAPSNQECFKGNNGISSSNSLGNHKISVAENGKGQFSTNRRGTDDLSNKRCLFGSLWIARFSKKTCSTSLNLNHTKRDMDDLGDRERPDTQNQKSPGLVSPIEEIHSDAKVNENSGDLGKNLGRFPANAESSFELKEMHSSSMPKLDSILPSQGPKSTEAMASVFARRLDALKHIIHSKAKNDATCSAPTCFYCGQSGHNLQDCSKIMESDLKDLLRNMSSCDWPEGSPCLCIRCFQIDHWAITCPVATSSRLYQLENEMSFVKCQTASKPIKCCFLDKGDLIKVGPDSRGKPFLDTGLKDPVSNPEEFFGRSLSSDEAQKQKTANSGEQRVRDHENLPVPNSVSMQILEAPKGIFYAVRRLQLSRADILKWINSKVSLSHLEGLFLRLRLGKQEARLGGPGYYVACITVEQAEQPAKDSKTSISVSVGGIKCLVGSQFVSNQNFLEDELMVWWSRTLRNGGKIPSTEDLETKYKQRIRLLKSTLTAVTSPSSYTRFIA